MHDGLIFHHSTTGELRFFWNAEAAPYPEGEFYQPAEALDPSILDPPIRPLILALNRTGWAQTVMSCSGHPERDNAYAPHVELWMRIPDAAGLGLFFEWINRAVTLRQVRSTVFKSDRLVRVDFIGRTRFGYYFVVFGNFVSSVENARIIQALLEALEN